MNGIHDMGGMHGMGPIVREVDKPLFHQPWESRVYAITRALRMRDGRWCLDAHRHEIERLAPADYLRMSYYERWLAVLTRQLLAGEATQTEIDSGQAAAGAPHAAPRLTAESARETADRRPSARRDARVAPRFRAGQRVRARNMHPTGHTRLPRYARGKTGEIAADRGVFLFPDTHAHDLGEKPQHLYSVRFAARELWGAQAAQLDAVYLDMWDDYLDHA